MPGLSDEEIIGTRPARYRFQSVLLSLGIVYSIDLLPDSCPFFRRITRALSPESFHEIVDCSTYFLLRVRRTISGQGSGFFRTDRDTYVLHGETSFDRQVVAIPSTRPWRFNDVEGRVSCRRLCSSPA